MTREECIALLERYAEYDGMGIPNLAGCREAMKMAADLLSQPSLQQEHPEVELEKFTEKIKTFQGRYKHPVSTSIKGAMAFMARMFYQYPNVARQWYEQLPKATMD